ncbi:hypothetical protein B5G34_00300 [Flavonifractor sp. An82]|nr:hypothetical protein B5G34_00300 [Flavonifractor sp. An82]
MISILVRSAKRTLFISVCMMMKGIIKVVLAVNMSPIHGAALLMACTMKDGANVFFVQTEITKRLVASCLTR